MINKLNLTPELLEKAKTAPSVAALLAFAQENGITLNKGEAERLYIQLHSETNAISDEELDNVSGGADHNCEANCSPSKMRESREYEQVMEERCSVCGRIFVYCIGTLLYTGFEEWSGFCD